MKMLLTPAGRSEKVCNLCGTVGLIIAAISRICQQPTSHYRRERD